jgi:hypothetical protein
VSQKPKSLTCLEPWETRAFPHRYNHIGRVKQRCLLSLMPMAAESNWHPCMLSNSCTSRYKTTTSSEGAIPLPATKNRQLAGRVLCIIVLVFKGLLAGRDPPRHQLKGSETKPGPENPRNLYLNYPGSSVRLGIHCSTAQLLELWMDCPKTLKYQHSHRPLPSTAPLLTL